MPLKTMSRRRWKDSGESDLTAAAAIDIADAGDLAYLREVVIKSKHSSERAWQWYNTIGEVHYAISRSARIAGYAKLRCVRLDDAGRVQETVTDGLAADIVKGIYAPTGGVRGLVSRFYTHMKVPAETYLIRYRDDDGDPDGYMFISSHEIDTGSVTFNENMGTSDLRWITLPGSASNGGSPFSRPIGRDDFLGRVWQPGNQFIDIPDSPIAAIDTECEALYILTKSIMGKLKSRFAMAGLLFLPNSIKSANVAGLKSPTTQRVDDVLTYLIAAMTRNITNWEDAIALVPILLRGDAEAGEQIKHIILDREVFDTDLELRRDLVGRVLFGMDIQQQATEGVGSASHWNAWAISDEERRIAVQPDLDTMTWALTRLILHRQLKEDGMTDEEILRHAVAWDMSGAATRANQQEDARQGHDRGLVNADASLAAMGFDPLAAKMVGDEYVRWVGAKVGDPYLALYGLPEAEKVDWGKVSIQPKPGPEGDPAEPTGTNPGKSSGGPDDQDRDTPRSQRPA